MTIWTVSCACVYAGTIVIAYIPSGACAWRRPNSSRNHTVNNALMLLIQLHLLDVGTCTSLLTRLPQPRCEDTPPDLPSLNLPSFPSLCGLSSAAGMRPRRSCPMARWRWRGRRRPLSTAAASTPSGRCVVARPTEDTQC